MDEEDSEGTPRFLVEAMEHPFDLILNGTPEDKVLRCSSMLFDEYCTRATRFGNLSPSSLVQVPSLLQ